MVSFLSKFIYSYTRAAYPLVASFFLPFCFLSLYLLLDYLYEGISDASLRLYYHDYFIALCVFIIDLIAPEDSVSVMQNAITSTRANLGFVRTCDGSTPFILIAAAILVFRSTLKLTLWGVFFALILVLFLNTIRIVSLYFLLGYDEQWFSYTHLTIAPFLLLSFSGAYFVFWAYYAYETKYGNA